MQRFEKRLQSRKRWLPELYCPRHWKVGPAMVNLLRHHHKADVKSRKMALDVEGFRRTEAAATFGACSACGFETISVGTFSISFWLYLPDATEQRESCGGVRRRVVAGFKCCLPGPLSPQEQRVQLYASSHLCPAWNHGETRPLVSPDLPGCVHELAGS